MAAMKASSLSTFLPRAAALLLAAAAIAALAPTANSQSCAAGLDQLSVCAPFVVSGSGGPPPKPSPQCCNALKGTTTDCLCRTYDIISKLPGNCNLPPVSCGA